MSSDFQFDWLGIVIEASGPWMLAGFIFYFDRKYRAKKTAEALQKKTFVNLSKVFICLLCLMPFMSMLNHYIKYSTHEQKLKNLLNDARKSVPQKDNPSVDLGELLDASEAPATLSVDLGNLLDQTHETDLGALAENHQSDRADFEKLCLSGLLSQNNNKYVAIEAYTPQKKLFVCECITNYIFSNLTPRETTVLFSLQDAEDSKDLLEKFEITGQGARATCKVPEQGSTGLGLKGSE